MTEALLSFSAAAVEKLQDNLAEYRMDYPGAAIRVGVKGGGCSGFTYEMDVDLEGEWGTDYAWNVAPGLRVCVDPVSAQYLRGTAIHFEKKGLVEGFVFSNPNAKRTCGCGSSFSD